MPASLALLFFLHVPADPPPARVLLLEGRGSVADASGVRELEPLVALEIRGEAYLEAAAGARLQLAWPRTASLEVRGPAALEWGPRPDGALAWRLIGIGELASEVRGGAVTVDLCGGWSARLQKGALFLRGLPGGAVELHHAAGAPVLLVAPGDPRSARPPLTVLAGARLRLEPGRDRALPAPGSRERVLEPRHPLQSGGARRARHAPWTGFAWPWGEGGGGLRPRPAAPAGGGRAPVEDLRRPQAFSPDA